MFGDTPPAIVAIDGNLAGHHALVETIVSRLATQPLGLVTPEPIGLQHALESAGMELGPGLSVTRGNAADALELAANRGSGTLRIWAMNGFAPDLSTGLRDRAAATGVRLRLEAPFAGAESPAPEASQGII